MRLALLPAAGTLALYAVLAAFEATRLPHTGAWVPAVSAAVLALAAVGLVAGRLEAYLFAASLLVLTTLAFAGVGVAVGWEALTGTEGGDWAAVRSLVLGMAGGVFLVVGAFSAAVVVTLVPAWRAVAAPRSADGWILSVLVALAGIGSLAWLVGHGYVYRRLPLQNQCLSGKGLGCQQLSNDRERFTVAERRAFARHGCEAGNDGACPPLAALLENGHGMESPEVRALAAAGLPRRRRERLPDPDAQRSPRGVPADLRGNDRKPDAHVRLLRAGCRSGRRAGAGRGLVRDQLPARLPLVVRRPGPSQTSGFSMTMNRQAIFARSVSGKGSLPTST